jgi:hypothetical protein
MEAEVINSFLEARRTLAEAKQAFYEARAAVLRFCPPGEPRGRVYVRMCRVWRLSAAAKNRLANLRKDLTAEGDGEFIERPAVYVLAEKQAEETAHE